VSKIKKSSGGLGGSKKLPGVCGRGFGVGKIDIASKVWGFGWVPSTGIAFLRIKKKYCQSMVWVFVVVTMLWVVNFHQLAQYNQARHPLHLKFRAKVVPVWGFGVEKMFVKSRQVSMVCNKIPKVRRLEWVTI